MKQLITLTTDLGLRDHYLASVKGKILSQLPDAQIVDISNNVSQHNVSEAAFMLKNVIEDFPKGTIHIVGVGAGSMNDIEHLIIEHKSQLIICANNGFFNLMSDEKPEYAGKVNVDPKVEIVAFPARDLYAPIAIHLAKGGNAREISVPINDLMRLFNLQPTIGPDFIKGSVQYVDSYGNAISNIHKSLIERFDSNLEFVISFRQRGFNIRRLSRKYSDVPEGERLALINSSGYLEIGINYGHASNLLGLKRDEIIMLTFS